MATSKKLFKRFAFSMSFDALLVFRRQHLFQLPYGKNYMNLNSFIPLFFLVDKIREVPEERFRA